MKHKPLRFKYFIEAYLEVPQQDRVEFLRQELRAKDRLHIFGRFFFPHIIKGDSETPECHLNLIQALASPHDCAIIFPREHAKTTWEKIDTIHDIVYALEPVILYVGPTLTDAGFHFESIKAELENNDLLIMVYGNLVPVDSERGKKWTNRHFETTNGVNVVARGACKGRGVNIKNQRPTKVILDDCEEDEQVQSAERRQKFRNWLDMVILPSMDKDRGKLKFIGTVIHQECEVLKFFKQQGGVFRKAIENGQPIWPQRFSLARLEVIKRGGVDPISNRAMKGIGSAAFAQEYMNNPAADGNIVKRDWIKRYRRSAIHIDKDSLQWVYVDEGGVSHTCQAYIGVDPAISQKKKADDRAIVTILAFDNIFTVGKNRISKKTLLVFREDAGKWSPNDFAKRLMASRDFAQPIQIAVESNAVQDLFRHWFNMYSISTTAINPDGDKVRRLNRHVADIEFGNILFPDDGSCENLEDELVAFNGSPNAVDNRVDALVYALDIAKRGASAIPSTKMDDGQKETVAGNLLNKTF